MGSQRNYSPISPRFNPASSPPFENIGGSLTREISGADASPTVSRPISSPNYFDESPVSPHHMSWIQTLRSPSKGFQNMDQSTGRRSGNFSQDFLSGSPLSPRPMTWTEAIRSPVKVLQSLEQSKDNASLLTVSLQSSVGSDDTFNLPLLGEVRLEEVKKAAKDWLKNPKNLAVCVWGAAVGISGAILFLVMVGLLDKQLPTKSQRDTWFEVNNQILNALFTMMCLYLHPQRCLHLLMIFRWQPQDITKLREVYSKNGTYKPHEWRHMLVVVMLLQINCFAQYALCGLNWGYKRSQRPAVGVGLCLAVAIGAPAVAGIYSSLSPLGKKYHVDEENDINMQEAQRVYNSELRRTYSWRVGRAHKMFCGEFSFASKKDGGLVEQPQWQGGLFECCQDPAVAVWSVACPFCVFGWNMERLGFGNRYVHLVTFVLLCTAPYWILTLAAINIDDIYVRKALLITGILLSILGLLYGGFWRIQMRKTFRLPASNKHPVLIDCVRWLFCAPCSLCQEVRTSEYYIIRESNFYNRRDSDVLSSVPSPMLRSPRAQNFISEASSPISFPTPPLANLANMSLLDRDDFIQRSGLLNSDGNENMYFPGMNNTDPMQAPAPQTVASHFSGSNVLAITKQQKQNTAPSSYKGNALQDRSNKL